MNRTNQRTVTTKVDVAEHLNHRITFNYELQENAERPISVTANAQPIDASGTPTPTPGMITVSLSGGNITKNHPTTVAAQLIGDMETEVLLIVNGEEA